MTELNYCSNWELTIRRGTQGITLLRAYTCDTCAELPGTLMGLPVTELSDHALSPGAAPVPGEAVRLICGTGDGSFDNRSLRELTLPASLEQAGNYAFWNCRSLQVLRLRDRPIRWGSGVFMNCRQLTKLIFEEETSPCGSSVAWFASELNRELDMTLLQPDGTEIRLLFPEYLEEYEENTPAHHFDYKIYGAGHPYHHVFHGKTLSLSDYDGLWEHMLRTEHSEDAALWLAYLRLRYPAGLSEKAETAYRSYVSARLPQALSRALEERDLTGVRLLLGMDGLTREALAQTQELARSARYTEASAILLEEQHRRYPAARRRFEF